MNRKHPEKLNFLSSKLPINVDKFSSSCRRTIKVLLESGNSDEAWNLVMKCRDFKENNSDKDRVIKISPSVIVLRHLIQSFTSSDLQTQQNQVQCAAAVVDKVRELVEVDSRIVSRAVITLVDINFESPERTSFIQKIIKQLLDNSSKRERDEISNYIGQSSKRRLKEASKHQPITAQKTVEIDQSQLMFEY